MPENEHLVILKRGVDIWNSWRKEHPKIQPNLSGTILSRLDFRNANFSYTNFENSNLRKSNFSGADLSDAILRGSDLTRAIFKGASLNNADLSEAIALGIDFTNADLSGANLSGIHFDASNYLGNPEHIEQLQKGTKSWNEWRDKNPDIIPDLREINLSGMNLTGVNFSKANLRGANLSGGNLNHTNMKGANLVNADLVNSVIQGCDFRNVDLTNADLESSLISISRFYKASLVNANLSQSVIKWIDFQEANFLGTVFGETIVSNSFLVRVRGMDKCQHVMPSTIDHITIANSAEIPIGFLRGIGLPDEIITSYMSLVGKESKYFSCFISYSNKDHLFASKLYEDLQGSGVRCWFAPEDMQGGKKLTHQIGQAIDSHDKLLLILSENSMSSNWVLNEIKSARKKENSTGKQMFFPICIAPFDNLSSWELIDPVSGENLAEEVLSYFIPNFNDSHGMGYEKGFSSLLKSLKDEPT